MPKAATALEPKTIKRYGVELSFTEPLLGSAPSDPNLYTDYIASKKAKLELKTASAEDKAAMTMALAEEELRLLPSEEEAAKGVTSFRRKDGSLILMDFIIRGYMKEASKVVGGMTASSSKVTKFVFIEERYIPLLRNGVALTKCDEVFTRPLRASTMQGPRVTLASSEMLNPPFSAKFTIRVLPGGQSEIDLATLQAWFSYSEYQGFGSWRNGSFGRAAAVVTQLSDGPSFGIIR